MQLHFSTPIIIYFPIDTSLGVAMLHPNFYPATQPHLNGSQSIIYFFSFFPFWEDQQSGLFIGFMYYCNELDKLKHNKLDILQQMQIQIYY